MAHPSDVPALETQALLALGRLDGALSVARPRTLRLLAGQQLRTLLIAALRQEGHSFTDPRFHAWCAGLVTLSDAPPRDLRAPRAVCEAILTELAHSSWEPLAALAARFSAALLAPQDHEGGAPDAETGHAAAHSLVTAARDLIAALEPSPLPLPALAQLHRALNGHIRFAPPERAPMPISLGPMRLTVERAALPSPRWSLEMLWGEHWRAAGLVAHALPFPGLIRLDAVPGAAEPGDARILVTRALREVAQSLFDQLGEADQRARRIADLQPGRRRTSRAPALLELLAGFGPLRSAQIETLLGATRLGVRAMLAALGDIGVLERTTVAGVRLYAADLSARPAPDTSEPAAGFAFSSAALGEYNAAMADIDALLARSGVSLDDAEEDD
ncbi:hypothetical protein [Novosphingobium olei]|uniref:Uncharacterized protein n=1 Tax=Novosphingobium olei TaxID=2728851 RepID=A0A7Y0BRC5_9SPHN|nr:hypothetical protein [Novosphingobium olei]NML95134.1 hypothetical protein [Novosphingobium olei]